jgi:translation elongation factor EF-G
MAWKNGDAMFELAPSQSPDYRETIRRTSIGDRKYIRFLSGRGHFGHLRLQLIPCPGEPCRVIESDGLEIPEPCCDAARTSLYGKFESGPLHHYPMFGLEVRMIGGTYLAKYSYPEAFAQAASMAFDEAVCNASPTVIERWSGFILRVDPDAVSETLTTLTTILGELPAFISLDSVRQCFVIRAEAPVRLLAELKETFRLRRIETYPLPREQQYRAMTEFPPKERPQGSPLDDWT